MIGNRFDGNSGELMNQPVTSMQKGRTICIVLFQTHEIHNPHRVTCLSNHLMQQAIKSCHRTAHSVTAEWMDVIDNCEPIV